MKNAKAGEWAYLVSVVIAVLAALAVTVGLSASAGPWVTLLLVVLGAIVGLLNISEKETTAFLVATIALIVASLGSAAGFGLLNFGATTGLGTLINQIVSNIAVFAAPAAIIVAVKAIMNLASKK